MTYIKKEKSYIKVKKILFFSLLSFVWLLIDSLFLNHFLATKTLYVFTKMNRVIPIAIVLDSDCFSISVLQEVIKELIVEYKIKLF